MVNWELLKAIREKGLRQKHFAKIVGDHETMVSRIVNGIRNPTDEQKKKYANALGKKPHEIFPNKGINEHNVSLDSMKEQIQNHFRGRYLNFYTKYLKSDVKRAGGNEYKALCPFHKEKEASLTINRDTGLFHCFGCGTEGDIFHFCGALNGLNTNGDFPEIIEGIAKDFGIDLQAKMEIETTYDYTNENGQLLFQKVRYSNKIFSQRRPDGNGGWIWDLEGVERVLYRLPEVLEASEILITKGEKDVDNIRALGLTATTNSEGARKWRTSYNEYLREKDIILIPDNDAQGREHMQKI